MNQEEGEALALDLYVRKIFRPYRPSEFFNFIHFHVLSLVNKLNI